MLFFLTIDKHAAPLNSALVILGDGRKLPFPSNPYLFS